MSTRGSDNRFLFGLLIGAGVGLAAAYLLDPKTGRQNRKMILDKAKQVADRVSSLESAPKVWRQRKIERAGRTLGKRVERLRTAGL